MTTARNVAGPPTTTNAVVDEEEVWEHCKRIQTAGLSEEVRRHSARNVLRVFAAVEPNRVQCKSSFFANVTRRRRHRFQVPMAHFFKMGDFFFVFSATSPICLDSASIDAQICEPGAC
jgi:hypothetical protein